MALGFAMTRCRHVPTTKAPVVTSTGAYAYCLAPVVEHQPVPLGHAYKYPNPSSLKAAVNSLFMAAE